MSQVKSFLPQMKMANQELQNKPAEEIDIEHVSEDQDRFIEMVHLSIILTCYRLLSFY